ncbi:hypothetical protein VTJ04DRAFT_64 [Mycothermus thermophilus]|uniref:uncharacterized protein n=1 Tax=Humicola insolens TaxID=85995 RepID=UPI003741ED1D
MLVHHLLPFSGPCIFPLLPRPSSSALRSAALGVFLFLLDNQDAAASASHDVVLSAFPPDLPFSSRSHARELRSRRPRDIRPSVRTVAAAAAV